MKTKKRKINSSKSKKIIAAVIIIFILGIGLIITKYIAQVGYPYPSESEQAMRNEEAKHMFNSQMKLIVPPDFTPIGNTTFYKGNVCCIDINYPASLKAQYRSPRQPNPIKEDLSARVRQLRYVTDTGNHVVDSQNVSGSLLKNENKIRLNILIVPFPERGFTDITIELEKDIN